jgi:tetratricopeptide (TPR) repeat protein
VELMKQAIEAGSPRDLEALSYCRVQLGELYFFQGRYEQARAEYDRTLHDLPRYAPALAARGRLNLVTGKLDEALADLDTSLLIQPLTAVRALYIDALQAAGRTSEATTQRARIDREGRIEDPRALSLYYSSHGQQLELAVDLASQEVQRRPDIWSLDASAWALFRSGKIEEAWIAIQGATRLGTRDPRLLFHRGRIAAARSDSREATEKLQAALAQSPNWDLEEPKEARELLARLPSLLSAPAAARPGPAAEGTR